MLNFPNTPAVGDTITLDGITWVWDGVKWSHPAGTGGGNGGAGGGQIGVTDGSNAKPGEVGEVITKSDFANDASGDPFNGYGMFTGTYWWTIPAGDWDVDGYLTFDSIETTAGNIWFNTIAVTVNDQWPYNHSLTNTASIQMEGQVFSDAARTAVDIGVVGALGYLVLPKFRANAADHAPSAPSGGGIGIDIGIQSPGGGFAVGIFMRARRMR